MTSPADARRVIAEGKLAVILGIETSNLFDCFLTPPPGVPACDEAQVLRELDRFHTLGVRALFPVHKFDNGFSAGDGDRSVGQIGSFINSGHYSNFVLDCPDVPTVFDRGSVIFGGLNMPRDDYASPAPNDMSGFAARSRSARSALALQRCAAWSPPLEGDYCQNAGLTPLGETLLQELMLRGMIIEVDHLPRRSFDARLRAARRARLPAGGHPRQQQRPGLRAGRHLEARPRPLRRSARAGAMGDAPEHDRPDRRQRRLPAEGFGFDLNGFAGGPRPRFGPDTTCGDTPQAHPITYPFTSYAGDVTFTEPHLGDRTVDFNTEGMIHIGLLPELIQDVRNDGVTDEELEPLFRSAEGYLRMWEKAEARGAALSASARPAR